MGPQQESIKHQVGTQTLAEVLKKSGIYLYKQGAAERAEFVWAEVAWITLWVKVMSHVHVWEIQGLIHLHWQVEIEVIC